MENVQLAAHESYLCSFTPHATITWVAIIPLETKQLITNAQTKQAYSQETKQPAVGVMEK